MRIREGLILGRYPDRQLLTQAVSLRSIGTVREIDIWAAMRNFGHFVAEVQATGEVVTITKDGVPTAVLLSADEFESVQETIYWLSQPAIREDIAQAEQDVRTGRTFGEDEIRAKFDVPKRPS